VATDVFEEHIASKTSVDTQRTARRYIPGDGTLNTFLTVPPQATTRDLSIRLTAFITLKSGNECFPQVDSESKQNNESTL
jgi:hypothetical protein